MMDVERYIELEHGDATLTPEELADGWYFCSCWDGMLIHGDWPESESCTCRE